MKNDENKALVKEQELLRKEVEKGFEEGKPATFRERMKVHHKIFGPRIVIRKTLFFVTARFNGNDKYFFFETIRY